jgi:NTP pyrophosphatase (non-canonical NTP hydrolase)
MNGREYIENCLATDIPDYRRLEERLEAMDLRILHAMLGIATEAGELTDAVKKHLMYGKPLDNVNLEEEAGDLMWYISLLLEALSVDYEYIWKQNIAKLKARFPEKFTEHAALHRNLNKERSILEED